MRRLYLFLLFILISAVFAGMVSAADADASGAVLKSCETGKCPFSENDSYCIYFFYGETCPHCAYIHPKIQKLAEKYPNFTLYELEIYYNETNQDLFQDFVKRYEIEKPGVPAVFISNKALTGSNVIERELEANIIYFLENEPVCPLKYNKEEATAHEISPPKKIDLTIGAVILAALIDSINPCAFAVLIFLLLYITTLGASRRILKVGIAYILSVFVVYFLAGLGLLRAIQSIGITSIVFQAAALISIAAGAINVKDFFWYGKGITLAIPESKKGVIEKYVQKASLPAAIILGVLVSMFELPCTGGIYLAILSLIAKNAYAMAVPYLLLYNLIFVLPLIIILLAVYFGMPAGHAEKFRLEKRKWLRLIMGIVMIALGAAMLAGVFG
ncbi:hypothetical protein HYT26_04385 [Candidatus Pacearchaeota archaeon]|nr:hypothetical protein [Candidatus Pacearchaeota archaeon]